jgi:hypothetical protein
VSKFLAQVKPFWPAEYCSYSEDVCLNFLDLCEYNLFKCKFHICNRTKTFKMFCEGKVG